MSTNQQSTHASPSLQPRHTRTLTPSALTAFLQGIERRALTVATLQCGEHALGRQVTEAALCAFRLEAPVVPMMQWPRQFWSLLAASDHLRHPPQSGQWIDSLQVLQHWRPIDRLAWLLRSVAGLEEAEAAMVLGLDEENYRQALARVCPRDAVGRPDVDAWRALVQKTQEQMRFMGVSPVNGDDPQFPSRVSWSWMWSRLPCVRRDRLVAGLILSMMLIVLMGGVFFGRDWHAMPVFRKATQVTAPIIGIESLPDTRKESSMSMAMTDQQDQAMLQDPEFDLGQRANFFAWLSAESPERIKAHPSADLDPRVNVKPPFPTSLKDGEDEDEP